MLNKYSLLQFVAEAGIPHGKPLSCFFYFLPFASAEHIFNELQIYGIDAASGAAILALDVRPGDHVLDLCAAPGKLPYQ
jgi:16S rRNA C967 or C1407 C5-methylase (RsmB/RsmF family)